MTGTIIKGIAGFYYVLVEKQIYECKARGKLKNQGQNLLAGDVVEVKEDLSSVASQQDMLPGTIEKVYERKNCFSRPPIANVDLCVLVAAVASPKPLPYVLDKMAIESLRLNAKVAICINKADLGDCSSLLEIYKDIFPCFVVSTKDGSGIDDLRAFIRNKKVAFCGQSGVGKSSLSNALLENYHSIVGEISSKSQKGKNTTRHSELFVRDDLLIFDTPGFTSFDLIDMDENELDKFYPEFDAFMGNCKFDDCHHINEPDCAIKNAIISGKINKSRYESYIALYEDIKKRRKY